MPFIFKLIIIGLSLLVADVLLPGVEIDGFWTAIGAAFVLMFMNAIIRPILIILSLPITLVTLGLFLFVVNALTYWWTASVVNGFHVENFWYAIIGAFITTIVSSFVQKKTNV